MPEVIGVHTGKFHLDDAMCCALLKMLPQYKEALIVRSSNTEQLAKQCTIICDVGGVYDHEKKMYDHHQKGFDEKFSQDSKIKHAASGLIYRHYGKQVLIELAREFGIIVLDDEPACDVVLEEKNPVPLSPSGLQECYDEIYWNFIAAIDAVDNGISRYPPDVTPLYRDPTSLSYRVSFLNPDWNAPSDAETTYNLFMKAIDLASQEFKEYVRYYLLVQYPAKKLFQKAFEDRFTFHPSGSILYVNAPWEKHLDAAEDNAKSSGAPITPTIYYIISYDRMRNLYNAKAVSADLKNSSFDLRLPFPQSWRGLRDGELEKVSFLYAPFCFSLLIISSLHN